MLLENQIENICHTGSSEQARAYLTLVEQLGIYLKELRTLDKASPMDEARSMLNKLLTAQEHERKEMEEHMLKRPVIFITSKPATKDWSTILGNPRSLPRMQSKSPLLGRLLPRCKP